MTEQFSQPMPPNHTLLYRNAWDLADFPALETSFEQPPIDLVFLQVSRSFQPLHLLFHNYRFESLKYDMNFLSRFTYPVSTSSKFEEDVLKPAVTIDQDDPPLLGLQRVLKDAQDPRRPIIGSWMMLPGASLARMVAQMGYDFVLVDCEHGNIDDAAMHASVGAIAAEGVSPIVRIPMLENVYVKRALDTGAHGILCPSISTADEARALVSYSKFPVATKPLPPTSQPDSGSKGKPTLSGIRGVGSPFAPSVFRQTLEEYIRSANRNTLVAVQIETVEGLKNCEEIANVDGIDMLFVGPNDLASSMGYPALSHESIPEVQEAIERILTAAHDAGKYAGMFCTEAAHIRKRFKQGFDLMNLGADIVALMEWNATQLAKLDDLTGKVVSVGNERETRGRARGIPEQITTEWLHLEKSAQ